MPHCFVIVGVVKGPVGIDVGASDAGDFFDIGEYFDTAFFQDFFGDISGSYDGGGVASAENAGADGIIVGAVLHERSIGCMARAGRAIRVLVLLDMNEMTVQVGD